MFLIFNTECKNTKNSAPHKEGAPYYMLNIYLKYIIKRNDS